MGPGDSRRPLSMNYLWSTALWHLKLARSPRMHKLTSKSLHSYMNYNQRWIVVQWWWMIILNNITTDLNQPGHVYCWFYSKNDRGRLKNDTPKEYPKTWKTIGDVQKNLWIHIKQIILTPPHNVSAPQCSCDQNREDRRGLRRLTLTFQRHTPPPTHPEPNTTNTATSHKHKHSHKQQQPAARKQHQQQQPAAREPAGREPTAREHQQQQQQATRKQQQREPASRSTVRQGPILAGRGTKRTEFNRERYR